MSQTWLEGEVYPRVDRYRVVCTSTGRPLLESFDGLSSLLSSLRDKNPAPQACHVEGVVIELWSKSDCVAVVCPERATIFLDGRPYAALLDDGWGAASWLAQRGLPETLGLLETRAQAAFEAHRAELIQQQGHRRGNARSLWREVAPQGLQEFVRLVEASGERDSPNRCSTGELYPLLERELESHLPEPTERARSLLAWLGQGFRQGQDLMLPHHLAWFLLRMPDSLLELADQPLTGQVLRGLEVLLRELPYDQGLSKSEKRKRKELLTKLGWEPRKPVG